MIDFDQLNMKSQIFWNRSDDINPFFGIFVMYYIVHSVMHIRLLDDRYCLKKNNRNIRSHNLNTSIT